MTAPVLRAAVSSYMNIVDAFPDVISYCSVVMRGDLGALVACRTEQEAHGHRQRPGADPYLGRGRLDAFRAATGLALA